MSTTIEYDLKKDCVVYVCSGPSANKVDPFSLGYPVAAVSTAIRNECFKDRPPDIWILADKINDMHGPTAKELYRNPDVLKVLPDLRRKDLRNLRPPAKEEELHQWFFCPYDNATASRGRGKRQNRQIFNGSFPFIRGPHKSVTFGIQWLHYIGAKTIIWAGCDLTATSIDDKYAYGVEETDKRKARGYLRTLNVVEKALREWYPTAQEKGFEWYEWECGEVLGNIIPSFFGKGNRKTITVSIPKPPKELPDVGSGPKRRERWSNTPQRWASRPVRDIQRDNNRSRRIIREEEAKPIGVIKNSRENRKQREIYDAAGRHISEPFINHRLGQIGNVECENNIINLPDEQKIIEESREKDPIHIVSEYSEDKKEQEQIKRETYERIKIRNMKRRL